MLLTMSPSTKTKNRHMLNEVHCRFFKLIVKEAVLAIAHQAELKTVTCLAIHPVCRLRAAGPYWTVCSGTGRKTAAYMQIHSLLTRSGQYTHSVVFLSNNLTHLPSIRQRNTLQPIHRQQSLDWTSRSSTDCHNCRGMIKNVTKTDDISYPHVHQ